MHIFIIVHYYLNRVIYIYGYNKQKLSYGTTSSLEIIVEFSLNTCDN
jgi:hypothetical protein